MTNCQCSLGGRVVLGRGKRQACIMLVGEAPGQEEDRQGIPFVGQAGKLLNEALQKAGLDRAEVYVTNAVKCRPPENRNPTDEEINSCKKLLLREIEIIKPKVIVTLGAISTKAILGEQKKGITKIRGQRVEWQDKIVLPTLHPAYVLRNLTKMNELVVDLMYAKTLSEGGAVQQGVYHVVKTIDEFYEMLSQVRDKEWLCFDLETTGLDFSIDLIVGIAFAVKPFEGWYVPLRKYSFGMMLKYWKEHDDEIWRGIRLLLYDPNAKKFNHNVKFDLLFLKAVEIIPVNVCQDTFLTAYLLNEEKGATRSLDFLSKLRPDLAGYKDEVKGLENYATVGVDRLGVYAGKDVDLTFWLKDYFAVQVQEQNLAWMSEEFMPQAMQFITEMEYTGIAFDIKYAKEQGMNMARAIEATHKDLCAYAGRDLAYNSPKQILAYFKELGIDLVDTKDKTLKATNTDVGKLILECRKMQKLISIYFETCPMLLRRDGRIHSSFFLATAENEGEGGGTVTGRLSSRNPNLQNVPARNEESAKLVKRLFIAKPGYILLAFDYSQAEFRIAAWQAQDEAVIEAMAKGADFHKFVASIIYNKSEDQITKIERSAAKNMNFAMLYGAGIDKVAESTGMSREEAKQLRDVYFRRAPKFKMMIDRYQEFAKRNGYVVSCFGRRRRLPNVNSQSDYGNSLRIAVNAPIQGAASDYALYQGGVKVLEALKKESLDCHFVNIVHDALYLECLDDPIVITRAWGVIKEVAVQPMCGIDFKMKIDCSQGYNWSEL